ncbi:MAG: ATP-binding protein, partial [Lachnospiraceae bacterium]|nr:ATP-binding protein [Lachnospiraceae bacterium]
IDELNDMIKRRDQFVADFTHEIKTPMTAIIGYADTMRSMDLDDEHRIMALNYIFTEGKRLEDMSMKLFDLIYLKNNDIEHNPISAYALGKDVESSAKPMLDKDNISLMTCFEQGTISGDRELLKTVFINLIDNARKASDKDGKIIFTGTKEDDAYIFTVQDFGVGISEQDLDRICDEFYMADKSRSRKKGGAGLGLSLASLILSKHNADLKIESKVGEGTKFIITFI